ncbi:MAG TPA: T9SS type A sorting domain-containing protein, partial [Bacteroidia bacterium]|nr:T9SS type A sorting domain-containing protein [Bacteroidia bacterium]
TGDTTSSITVNATAVYSVDVTNTSGCMASDTVSVTILAVPVVDLGPDSSYCGPVVIIAGAGGDTYLWSTGDTTAAITANATAVYSVDVTNASGCTASDTVSIIMSPLPVINVSGNNAICNGDSTTLTASGTDMYMWINGPATASNTVAPTADSTFWVVGTDMISGCSDTVSYLVTIYQSPMIAQSVTVCGGDSVVVGSNTYTVSGVYYDTLATVNGCDSLIVTTLNVDNGTVTTQNVGGCQGFQVTVGLNTYDTTGTYTDTLVSTFGCDSTVITNLTISAPISVTQIIQGCDTAFSVTVGNNTYNTSGTYVDTLVRALGCDSIVTTNLFITTVFNSTTTVSGFGSIITANNTNPNVTYQWMNCTSGLQILGATNQAYYAAFNGSYAVIVTENGCPDTSACVSVVNVGIADPATNGQFSVYPNPTLSTITVTNDVPTEIVIFNTLGEVVHAQQIQTTATIDLSTYEGGVYFIRTSEGQMVRLVKE